MQHNRPKKDFGHLDPVGAFLLVIYSFPCWYYITKAGNRKGRLFVLPGSF